LVFQSDGDDKTVILTIPAIHCSSCVYVLEKLYRLNSGIRHSEVDFLRKELSLQYNETETSLKKIAILLTSLGYEPKITLSNGAQLHHSRSNSDLYLKIGIAGFAFGNIMLMSFPEYLAVKDSVDPALQRFFSYFSLLLSLPVLLISARGYMISALAGAKQRIINIDVPITLGILTLFSRSAYEIISTSGTGYMDSFAALVFLLLLGKLFQQKTYDTLSFDHDYRTFFPIYVMKKQAKGEVSIPLSKLEVGDRIVVRNGEIVPADSVLIHSNTSIDYSFVTGESAPSELKAGDVIYAGGRQVGGAIELDVVKGVSQSYLTRLWNQDIYNRHHQSHLTNLTDAISTYFTTAIILLACSAALFWFRIDTYQALNAFTAVLIIACPCALALSAPFALGTAMRILGERGFFLKNAAVIERLAKIRSIVFDKTGTLTTNGISEVEFIPQEIQCEKLTLSERAKIYSLAYHTNHPLGQQICAFLRGAELLPVRGFEEIRGMGIRGTVDGQLLKLGSDAFVEHQGKSPPGTAVFFSIDGKVKGHFRLHNKYRQGLAKVLSALAMEFDISLLSGDKDSEKAQLKKYFSEDKLHFCQTPFNKLEHIRNLQERGENVLMMGDGLNDAGSLIQSNVGISISEDKNTFSPACDGILDANSFDRIPAIMQHTRDIVKIIYVSFGISLLYNILGLAFAVTGKLSPLISAVLMPVSSISVVVFAAFMTRYSAGHRGLLQGKKF